MSPESATEEERALSWALMMFSAYMRVQQHFERLAEERRKIARRAQEYRLEGV